MIKQYTAISRLICLLTFGLLISGVTSHAQSSRSNGNTEKKPTAIYPWENPKQEGVKRELTAQRSQHTKHYLLENGQSRMYSAIGSIHYNEGGIWKEINVSIKANSSGKHSANPYFNSDNRFKTYYPNNPSTGKIFTNVIEGEMQESISQVYAIDQNGNVVYQFPLSANTSTHVDHGEITYDEIFPNAAIRYTLHSDGRKFDLILKNNHALQNLPASAKYLIVKEKLQIPAHWQMKETANGVDIYTNKTWIANIPAPTVYDASNNLTTSSNEDDFILKGNLSLTNNGNEYSLLSKFSIDWLKSNQRTFPINIDPVVNFYPDTCVVCAPLPTITGYINGAPSVANQKVGGIIRLTGLATVAWAKFNISTLPAGSLISSGSYNSYHYNGTGASKFANLVGLYNVDPVVATNDTLHNRISTATSANIYNSSFEFGGSVINVFKTASISGNGLTDIATQQAQGWTALGLKAQSGNLTGAMLHRGYNTTQAQKPYLTLDYSTSSCAGTPVAGQATSTLPDSLACGDPFTLNLVGYSTGVGTTFQWESSPAGTNTWTSLGGLLTAPFYTTSQTSATDYRCIVTCTSSALSDTSTVLPIGQKSVTSCYCIPTGLATSTYYITKFSTGGAGSNISNTTNAYSTSPALGYGNYTSMMVSANPGTTITDTISFAGGAQYVGIWVDWNQDGDFNDTGENPVSTTVAVTSPYVSNFTVPLSALVGPTRLRIRTLFGSPALACPNSANSETEDYTLNVLGPCSTAVTATLSPVSSTICPATTQALSATVPILQLGTTFQWKEGTTSGGPYTDIVGATSLNYTPPALSAGNYYYILETTCANCGPCSVTSNEVTIVVQDVPAPTATNSAQCAPGVPTAMVTSTAGALGTGNFNWYSASIGGTLLQGRPYGPLQVYYTNDFSSSTLTNAVLTPAASITGGELQLHPNTVNQYGAFHVNASGYHSSKYQIDFDVSTSGTAPLAEGFSYSFGDSLNTVPTNQAGTMNAENGVGTKLKVAFVPNGTGSAGIYLLYNTSAINEQTPSSSVSAASLLVHSPNTTWLNTPNNHVTIAIDTAGKVTLTLNGNIIFNQVQLPAAYKTTPTRASWRHVWKGRTSLSTMLTTFDNIVIQCDTLTVGAPTYLSQVASTTTFYVSEVGVNGCNSQRTPVTVTVNTPPIITANAAPNDSVCTGAPITLSGAGAITYLWNGNGTTVNGDTTFSNAVGGTYTVTGIDANSCSNTATIQIYTHPVLNGTTSATPSSICLGASTSLNAVPTAICTGLSTTSLSGYYTPSSWTLTNIATNGTTDFTLAPASMAIISGNNNSGLQGSTSLSRVLTCPGIVSFNWNFAHPDFGQLHYPEYKINSGAPVLFPGFNISQFGGSQTGTISLTLAANDTLYLITNTLFNDPVTASLTISNFNAPSPKLEGTTTIWDAATGGTNLGAPPISVTPSSSGSVNYYAEYTTTATGCVNLVRQPISVQVNPLPTATVSGGGTVCAGATLPDVEIALTGSGPWSLTYTDGTTPTTVNGIITSPYTITAAAAGVYSVTSINDVNCTGTQSGTATVVVNSLPTAAISGGGSVCPGATLPDVSISLTGTSPWNLMYTDGTSTYTVNAIATSTYLISAAATGTYSVTSIQDATCGNTSTGSVTVSNYTAPNITATSSVSTTCANTMVTLNGGGGVSYVWTGGVSDNTPFALGATNTFTVTGTDANTCTGTSSVSINVTAAAIELSNASSGNSSSLPGASNGNANQPASSFVSYYSGSCNLLASISSTAALGNTLSAVEVETSVLTHNGQPFVPRWFQITPTNNTSADIVFYLTQDDFNDYNAYAMSNGWPLLPTGPTDLAGIGNLRVTKNANAGMGTSPVVLTPTSVIWNATNSYWEITVNVPSFSQFRFHALNPSNAPLPVSISSFTGRKENNYDVLNWVTSAEQNNAYFNLQHSTDGINFSTIDKVASMANGGNSASPITYQSIHKNPVSGRNYYRLTQTDWNENTSIVPSIVELTWAFGSPINLYPNPVKDVLNIDITTNNASRLVVKVIDMSGRLVKQVLFNTVQGMNNISVDMKEIAKGLYTVQLLENGVVNKIERINKQ